MSESDYNLTGEEEVVAKPKGHEYTQEEEQTAKKEMTFYGSSKWCEMVSQWQKEHPLTKKVYTEEEIRQSDIEIKRLNEEWKRIKEEQMKTQNQARERLGLN